MTKDKLRRRMSRKLATPLPPSVEPLNNNRRGKNHVDLLTEEELSHDDFFDFEKDLVDIKSSRSLAAGAPGSQDFFTTDNYSGSITQKEERTTPSFILMEEAEEEIEETPVATSFGIMLEEIEEEETNNEIIDETADTPESVKFEFVQCGAIKNNGDRCKRQAPKGFETCSIAAHRKQEASINKEKIGEDGKHDI